MTQWLHIFSTEKAHKRVCTQWCVTHPTAHTEWACFVTIQLVVLWWIDGMHKQTYYKCKLIWSLSIVVSHSMGSKDIYQPVNVYLFPIIHAFRCFALFIKSSKINDFSYIGTTDPIDFTKVSTILCNYSSTVRIDKVGFRQWLAPLIDYGHRLISLQMPICRNINFE